MTGRQYAPAQEIEDMHPLTPDVPSETLDEHAALEMLSRAIRGGDHAAWQAFVNQYSSLVMSHVRRHPAYLGAGEDDSFWLNRTFQRFARAVGPDRLDLFPNLATVLGYLKMCAHSVLLDEARARRRHAHVSLEQVADCAESGTDLEGSVIQRMAAQELWEAVMQALPEESDRLIARLSFKHGCKPGKIQARYRDRFPSVADVYRAKRNVLDRLRRNPQVRRFLA